VRRILKEAAVLVVVLLVAGTVIFVYTQAALTPTRYDAFPGRVNKIPLQISSPVYGQLLSLPLTEGSQVNQGQVIATIQVLDRNFRLPANSHLFTMQGDTLSVVSPATGVVAKVSVAPLSTVGGNEKLVELYTPDSTDVWMLLPQGTDLNSYDAFFVSFGAKKPSYRLRVAGLMPSDIVSGVSPTTNVYRATCESMVECADLLVNQQVTICAEKTVPKPGLASMLQVSWLSVGAKQQACDSGG
jgi:hypothetical protein